MHVLMTGSSGLIGSRLTSLLERAGHQVTRLVRRPPKDPTERQWDPQASKLDPALLAGGEALIHLAGENIASGRWNSSQKQEIRDSRVISTRLLAQAIAAMPQPLKVWGVASAIGYYGDRGDEVLTEESAPGEGFLPEVCQEWEQAADPARDHCRVVHVRSGMVLSDEGGALKSMLLPFRLGVGGVVGSGAQYWSWISREDAARLFQFVLETDSVSGPVNGVSPQPVTNREFTKTLGRVLRRPTVFPMPAPAARLALGEMADALILASARVVPQVPQESGFTFQHRELEPALRAILS